MEDTCKKSDCHLWKKYREKCPNYVRSGWRSVESNQEKTIHDCAPIRTMLMLQELYNRLIGVEKVGEQTRNALVQIGKMAQIKMLEE
jgi:hypothetical protein